MRTDTGQVIRLEDYRPPAYTIDNVRLTFALDPKRTIVTASLDIRRGADTPPGTPLVLDGDALELVSLAVAGTPASDGSFEASPDRLTISQPPAGDLFTVDIVTALSPDSNTQLMGLYRSRGTYCTQCEAEGFRRITYFADRPDVLAVYTVRIEAKRADCRLLLSNGNLVGQGALADGRHFAVWHDPYPKPSYLFALVAGELGCLEDSFTTASGRHVALRIYVEHGKEARATYAMDALKRSIRWDEERFGREYDLDIFMIVAVSDFNMGAMENKGLNVFNDKYVLADPETATDADYAAIEAIIAHEYFHNWTGNRITCRDWFQLCLKEGLTVYRDHEFSADQRSRAVKRIAEVRLLKAHQFPEDAGPLAHPVRPRKYREINNFYTSTVYEKGSEVVRMIETIVGRADFRRGLDLYFDRHDGEAATVEQFVACFEEVSGRDLSQFSLWYTQAGTPNLTMSSRFDRATGTLTLQIEQTLKATPGESRKRLMHIPVRFGLVGPEGEDVVPSAISGIEHDGDVLHVRKRKHAVTFHGLQERPVISLLRGFSAPVTVMPEQADDDLVHLSLCDGDLFSRWQSLHTLFLRALKNSARDLQNGAPPRFVDDIAQLAVNTAMDASLEPAFRALAVQLPAEVDVGREMGENIDPDAIHAARNHAMRTVAIAGEAAFARIYHHLAGREPFSPDADSAGRRALKFTALEYLLVARGRADLAATQYRTADNMTDRSAALQLLAHRLPDAKETADALVDFRRRYSSEPIVLDKWFTIQATIPGEGAFERVRGLVSDPAFTWDNPNRVRALTGAFATGNPTGFNRPDGKAYDHLADVIIRLDARNPQLAARLLTSMRSWRSMEPVRREAARKALSAISRTASLSADVRDIVDRMLA